MRQKHQKEKIDVGIWLAAMFGNTVRRSLL